MFWNFFLMVALVSVVSCASLGERSEERSPNPADFISMNR